MKKKLIGGIFLDREKVRKIWMTMRLIAFLFFVSLIHVSASVYSQKTKLNIRVEDASLQQVFKVLQEQSEFDFFYKNEQIPSEARVSIQYQNESIEVILDKILDGTGLTYHVLDKDIVISSKGGANNEIVSQQQKSVSGKVTDSSGSPLPGVSVVVKGTTNGNITDGNGNYSLSNVPENATLQFSFVGMKGQEMAVGGKTSINVSLADEAIGIEEVVAVGYGTSKKKDLTGSVSSVSAAQLREAPITRLDQGLQGKISGVRIQNSDGTPGVGSKVRIRGSSSVNFSNDPLYVVDGFIGADISTINPKDIQSIDILKDASSTAIYGSRGANGVVIITTNTPAAGAMKVTFDASYGMATIPAFLPMTDFAQSLDWINEMTIAQGGTAPLTASDISSLIAQGETDWQKEVTQNGNKSDINIGITGGSENLKYFVSGNYYNENGVMLNSEYRRYSLRSNIAAKLNKRVDLVFNTFGTSESRQGVGRLTIGQYSAFGKAFNFPRVWPAYDADGLPTNSDLMNNYRLAVNPGGRANPLAQLVNPLGTNITNNIQSNIDLTFKVTDHLKLLVSNSAKNRASYRANQSAIAPPETYRANVAVSQANGHSTTLINYDMLTYDKKVGNHAFKVDGIYEFIKSTDYANQIAVSNLSTLGTGYYSLGVGIPSEASSDFAETKWRSYMGRINYSFKDKYLVTVSLRADGSSKFQETNRWGYFPSGAFAWRISEEGFIKDIETISNLKFRLGYGEVGNASIPAYSTLQLLTTQNASYDYYDNTTTTVATGIRPGNLVDPNLKWEVSKQFDVGLDWGLFDGRLSGVVDYYNKKVDDLILKMAIPSINGTGSFLTNVGNIRNSGLELSFEGVLVNHKEFSLKANFNISFNKSEVLSLGDVDRLWTNDSGTYGMPNVSDLFVVNKGEPLGQLWGYRYLGTWKTGEETEAARYLAKPGNARYEDLNDDGKYGSDDKQVIANTSPTSNLGFGVNMRYKNIDLAINTYGAMGFDIYNESKVYVNGYDDPNMANRWTAENQTDVPIWSKYSDIGGQPNSRKVEKGDFVKIGNATLGYTFGKNILNKIGLSSSRIYVSGQNLMTFSKYSGIDPENAITPTDSDAIGGIDNFGYPSTRTFTFGINVGF